MVSDENDASGRAGEDGGTGTLPGMAGSVWPDPFESAPGCFTGPWGGQPSPALDDAAHADDLAGAFEAPPLLEALCPSAEEKAVGGHIGIRFRKAGQLFFFPDGGLAVRPGVKVIVQLEQGPAFGEVESVLDARLPPPENDENAQGKGGILRLATAEDAARHAENNTLAAEASVFCKTCIRQRELDMKLVDVEVLHDRGKIIFFFTAPSRIDFRELVKDLVRTYRTRIELRQIGVRHETQMVGAIGNCGMVCCCHRYLRKFAPVTIKMAKEQNLFLNPSKLSGMCGRLLCCLSFEQGNYEEFNHRCPKIGKRYETLKGVMRVLRTNIFSRTIAVHAETGEEMELSLDDWDALEPRRAEGPASEQPRGDSPIKQGDRREHGRRNESRRARHDKDAEAQDQRERRQDKPQGDSVFGLKPNQDGKPRQ